MKKIILSFLLIFIAVTSFGQGSWYLNFDSPLYMNRVIIDTTSNSNSIWQIGHPSKTTFTSAFSIPKSLVTDTLNPVPPNDTSTFYLIHVRPNPPITMHFGFYFYFRLDGDLTDFGTVEVSPDNGLNWINILTQDTTYKFSWNDTKPTLVGSTVGWQLFSVDMHDWALGLESFPIPITSDTIRLRFTYITDSNSSLHDGWIIDNFFFEDYVESGIDKNQNNNLFSIYPNPAKDQITIKVNQHSKTNTLQIINYQGQILYTNKNFTENIVDISQFNNGLYFLKYSDTKNISIKKFAVHH